MWITGDEVVKQVSSLLGFLLSQATDFLAG